MEALKERFNVAFQVADDLDANADDFREFQERIGDDKLDWEGGRRVSEWTWTDEVEDPWTFGARVAELRQRIGEPWEVDGDPDNLITAEDVDRIEQAGPIRYRIGKCWAVRA